MKFKTPSGGEVNVNIMPYRIDWSRAVSKPQKRVKDFLYPYWKAHLVLEEFRVPRTKWRIDLLDISSRVAIEVSPASSHSYNKFFHRGSKLNFANSLKRDLSKRKWIEDNGFTYVEIVDEDMDKLSREWFKQEYGVTL